MPPPSARKSAALPTRPRGERPAWLLARRPACRSPRRSHGLAEERRRPARSVELCAELGGAYLVHGSPAQRRVADPSDAARAEEAWAVAARRRERPASSTASSRCAARLQLRQHAGRGRRGRARIGNPAFRTMVDTLAASLMEPEPVADAIRRWMPTGLMAHIQFNDRNRRGPGQGDDKFAPVVARCAKPAMTAGSPWSLSSMSLTARPVRRA
jgi:sugar phosphate isomerase/epimerase